MKQIDAISELIGNRRSNPLLANRFRLGRIIHDGPLSIIIEAKDLSSARPVVIKSVANDYLNSQDMREMLWNEADASALVRHPGVVSIKQAGDDNGRPYLVMERVEGEPLWGLTCMDCLGIADALDIFSKLCDALAEVHRQGIIHRDLKTSNFLVTNRSGKWKAKIIDFGYAYVPCRFDYAQKAGHPVGTSFYMAPEGMLPKSSVDARADIFSLGVSLYETLSGKYPYSLPPYRISDEKIIELRQSGGIVPLGIRFPRFGPELCRIVDRAINIDRSKRFQSVIDMKGEIDFYLKTVCSWDEDDREEDWVR